MKPAEPVDHEAALKRALLAIRDLRRRLEETEARATEPVAIVGMACRLPGGATTPEKLWDLLRTGMDASIDVPKDRWDADAVYDPDPEAPGCTYVRRGSFLREPVDRFDAGFFNISPREAAAMDPLQRMLLELAWESLERAGIPPLALENSDTGVFIGLSGSDYAQLQNRRSRDEIDSYGGTGTAPCIASGRISYFLGLQGPNVAIDTACSSGLVALTQAVQSLRQRRCSLALAGSSHLMLSPEGTIFLCRMRALSPEGRCRTFDAKAGGYGRSEGGAMFVLKRLADAVAAGDRVLAVVRGAATNHDGRSSGLTVPNPAAQRALITAAIRDAGIDPLRIGYVETHGTATPLGDPIEMGALAEVLCRNRPKDQPLIVGSIKTNLGHAEPVAGLAGLLKLVLSLQHRQIPEHLHFTEPSPQIDWARCAVKVPTALMPWPDQGAARVGGVSAFGFSGTNAHVIVEEAAPPATESRPRRPVELIALSGRSKEAVGELAGRYRAIVKERGDAGLSDLGASSTAGRSHLSYRAVVTGADTATIDAALAAIEQGAEDRITRVQPSDPGPIAFLFTGQGAQYPGMARELYETAPVFRAALDRCAMVLDPVLDRTLLSLVCGAEAADVLKQTAYAQPALFAVEYALAELWQSWGVKPAYVLGHSVGEYVAAVVSGVMELDAALRLVALRGRLMQALPAGGRMTAVHAPEAKVAPFVARESGVAIAALNSPTNTVLSGPADAVERVLQALRVAGIEGKNLEVSHAFHSPLMEPMLDEFERAVAALKLSAPGIPLISNLTADVLTDEDAASPSRWRRHIRESVRFAGSIQKLHALGVRDFLEAGPHPTLCSLGMATINEGGLRWLPSLRRNVAAWPTLAESLGTLYRRGHDIDWSGWTRDYAGSRAGGPTYPFQRTRYWMSAESATSTAGRLSIGSATQQPLLGSSIQSPAVAGHLFQIGLRARHPRYLADHRVQGHTVVPGMVYVEVLLEAAREALGWEQPTLADLTFAQPLVLPDEGEVTVQVILDAPRDGRHPARIISASDGGASGRWTTHAGGVLSPAVSRPASGPDRLRALQASLTRPADVRKLYEQITRRGITYGPAFRSLASAWTGAEGALGRAEFSGTATPELTRHLTYPMVVDAGLQLLESLTADPTDSTPFMPAGVDEIRWHTKVGASCWIHGAIRAHGADTDRNLLIADVTYFDAEGTVLLELIGFRARRVRQTIRATAARQDMARSIYAVRWEEVSLPAPTIPEVAGTWLVLEDERRGVGAALCGVIEARGGTCIGVRRSATFAQTGPDRFTVNPAVAADFERMLDATGIRARTRSLRGVLHLWALDAGPDAVLDRLLAVTSPLIDLVRAGALDGASSGLRVVTAGAARPGTSGSAGWQAGAALWGSVPVLQAEYPKVECRLLDLGADGEAVDAERLLAHLLAPAAEDRLVLEGDRTLAPRLEHGLESHDDNRRPIPAGESYQIHLDRRGTLDAIRYVAVPRTAPGTGQVEVRVRTTGLNFRDVLNVLGSYPGNPGAPGIEFAGTVSRVGAGVTTVSVGEEVIGIGTASFAAYVTTSEHALARRPRGLSATEATTVPLPFLTAEYGLVTLGRLRAGERVLIHAAAGGVGQAAVQLARDLGAEIFATAGSEPKRALLRAQGVRHVFDSRSTTFVDEVRRATRGEGIDVVLNSLTGDLLQGSLALLRPGGRFLELGKAEIFDPAEIARRYPGVNYQAYDLSGLLVDDPVAFQAMFRSVVERFERGALAPLRTRVFAAEDIVAAFRFMAQARHIGKVIVTAGRVPPAPEQVVRGDGTYLVTGATGGVGQAVVEWLVGRGAGAVVLNSRSAPTGETEAWFDGLARNSHRADWVAGDIGQPGDVATLIARCHATGLPLRGVFHCAGTLEDGLLETQTRERFARVLQPKAAGAWHLHEATASLELDHFVLFSSVSGTIGGAGQSNYGAANLFLDALAEHRAAQGLPALSIAWGAWAGRGMAARIPERERKLLESRGLGFLDPQQAIATMERLLTQSAPRAVVAEIDWSRSASTMQVVPPILRALLAENARDSGTGASGVAEAINVEALRALPPPARAEQLTRYVQRTLSSVLGQRGGEVAKDAEIAQLGFDSLMAMELRNRIESDLGLLIPVARLLTSITTADLAEEVVAQFGLETPPAVPAMAASDQRTEGEI